jgi:hypothetical protein
MPSKTRNPDFVYTSVAVPIALYRMMKARAALDGVSIRERLNELLAREYGEVPEALKRKRRQPSRFAQLGAE